MKYSEKKLIQGFFNCVIISLCKASNNRDWNELHRLLNNAPLEFEDFLDDDLSYINVKTFSPIKDTLNAKG